MERVTIVVPSLLTVPAINGGAVESLLTEFLAWNERHGRVKADIVCHYEKGVEQVCAGYQHTRFHYLHYPHFLIRVSSVFRNSLSSGVLTDYERRLSRKIESLGNQTVLFEGGGRPAILYKKAHPSARVFYHLHADLPLAAFPGDLDILNDMHMITVSDYVRRQRQAEGILPEHVTEVLNGVNLDMFDMGRVRQSREEICQSFGLPADKLMILFSGRIVRVKGIMELLKAFSRIESRDVILLIVGSRNFGEKRVIKNRFEREVDSLICADSRIRFTGYVPYEKMPLLQKIADIAVVPSIYQEACALTTIEAIVSGTPLISTNMGGIPENCAETKAVLLDVDDNFTDSLEQALRNLLQNPGLREEISASQLRVRERFDFERYYAEMCRTIQT